VKNLKILYDQNRCFFAMTSIIAIIAFIIGIGYIKMQRRHIKLSIRSESKTPIYDASYQLAPTEEDHYRAVCAPDGTKYIVVESNDVRSSNDKRALV